MIFITPFVFLLFPVVRGTSPNPCGQGWTYSASSGKCYKFFIEWKNMSDAESACNTQPSNEVYHSSTLAIISTEADMNAVVNAAGSNFAQQWIGAKMQSGIYRWTNGHTITDSGYWSPEKGTGDCISLLLESKNVGGKWTIAKDFIPTDCSALRGFFCEYTAKVCDVEYLKTAGYNNLTMILSPPLLTVQTRGSVACREGYYRDSQLSLAAPTPDTNGLYPNTFHCGGNEASDRNPNMFTPVLDMGIIEVCKAIECSIPTFNVSNVVAQPPIVQNTATGFAFNSTLPVQCLNGFVNFQDDKDTNSAMWCKQSKRQPNQGYWTPGNLQPCVGVRCNLTELLLMEPFRGTIVNAVNKRTKVTYDGTFQKSELNRYDNVVTVKCNDGYFFETRSPTETVICDLKTGSRTIGEWKGYQGTRLPIPKSCKVVTCKYQDVTPTESNNFQSTFLIKYPNGTYQKANAMFGEDFLHNTVIRFWCVTSDYETANQNSDQNVTCNGQGLWTPQMTGCIQKTKKLETNGKKHYEPPPKEAVNAQQIGVVTIVILLLFFGLIIVLDLSTVTREVALLRRNIQNIKYRLKSKHSD